MAAFDGKQRPEAHQIRLAKQILEPRGKPLSWRSFAKEFEIHQPIESYQELQDAFCGLSVPGLLCSRGFVSLDNARCTALLKLELILAATEHSNIEKLQLVKISHYFNFSATKEERCQLGNDPDSLLKMASEFPDIFVCDTKKREIRLKPEAANQHEQFFQFESDSKVSAIHKLKYFLFLCKGTTSHRSAFEFSRCILNQKERSHIGTYTIPQFIKALNSLKSSINVGKDVVQLLPSSESRQDEKGRKETCCIKEEEMIGLRDPVETKILSEEDISQIREMLADGPLTWECIIAQLGKGPEKVNDIFSFKKSFYRLKPTDFVYSSDFISLDDPTSVALLKLQFVVVIVNRLLKYPSLDNNISYHFNVLASAKEKSSMGKNPGLLLESLKKWPELFNLQSPDVIGKCTVKPSSKTINFESFFELEGEHRKSAVHKLKYYIKMCKGSCSISAAFEFSRNNLTQNERTFFDNGNKELFRKGLGTFNAVFQVYDDVLKLHETHLSSSAALTENQNNGDKFTTESRLKIVKGILEKLDHPITWEKLEDILSSSDSSQTWDKNLIVEDISSVKTNPFIHSEDFISLRTPEWQGFLKLCLIVRMTTIFNGDCGLYELYKASRLTLDRNERRAFYGDIQSFLKSHPAFFEVVGNSGGTSLSGRVNPGGEMFKFDDFFRCFEHDQKLCRPCQLIFFVNISGGKSRADEAFQFMKILSNPSYLTYTSLSKSPSSSHELTEDEFDVLIKKCHRVNVCGDPGLKLLPKTEASKKNVKQPTKKVNNISSRGNVSSAVSNSSLQGNEHEPPPELKPALSCPSETGRKSTKSSDYGSLEMPSISDDSASATPSIVEERFERTMTDDPSDSRETSPECATLPDVFFQVSNNYADLAARFSVIQNSALPVVAMACHEDTLVVLNSPGSGSPFQIPTDLDPDFEDDSPSEFWSLIWNFFRDPRITFITFDCEDVAEKLLEKLGIHLSNVFDIKIALEVISSGSNDSQLTGLSISDVCHTLGLPGPHSISFAVNEDNENDGAVGNETLEEVMQELAAMYPGVYSWTLQKLSALNAVEEHRELTNDRLRHVYTKQFSESLTKLDEQIGLFQSDHEIYPSHSHFQSPDGDTNAYPEQVLQTSSGLHDGGNQHFIRQPNVTNLRPPSLPSESSCSQDGLQVPSASSAFPSMGSSSPSSFGAEHLSNSMEAAYPRITSSSMRGSAADVDQNSMLNPSFDNHVEAPSDTGPIGRVTQPREEIGLTPSTNYGDIQIVTHNSSCLPVSGNVSPVPLSLSACDEDAIQVDLTPYNDGNVGKPLTPSSRGQGTLEEETLCLCKEGDTIIQVPKDEWSNYDSNLSGLSDELMICYSVKNQENMGQLFCILGKDIATTLNEYLQYHNKLFAMAEIVLDVGRRAEARFHKSSKSEKQVVIDASARPISITDIKTIANNEALTGFDEGNRCGVEGSLHSIRGLRNKKQKLIGLTIRIGLPLLGCADMVYDIAQSGKSTLIVGYSGVGKTTLLRELARCLSDNEKKRVAVCDTYNEIAGDDDVPHYSIGSARRLQVDKPQNQHRILLEGARNHGAEVVIVDQIDNVEDSMAMVKLIDQGLQVIAGVNRDAVSSVCNYPELLPIFQVTDDVSEDAASLDSASALSKYKPAFEALIEMRESDCWYIHNLGHTYNNIRMNQPYSVQERRRIWLSKEGLSEQQILLREITTGP